MTDEHSNRDVDSPVERATHKTGAGGSNATARSDASGADQASSEPICVDSGEAIDRDDASKIAKLHEMATQIVACRDETRLYDLAVQTAEGVLEFDTSAIIRYEDRDDGEWLVQKAVSSTQPVDYATEFPPDEGVAGETFQTGESYRVDDAHRDSVAEPARENFRSAISVPIGDLGVFQAISTERAAFDQRDVELAEILASHIEATLRRIRVEERLRDRRRTVTRLHEGTAALTGAASEDDLFERTVEAAEGILEMDVCYLGIVEDGQFVPKGRSSWPIRDDLQALPLDYGIMGDTYETGDSFLVTDAAADERTHDEVGTFSSCISVPIGEFGVVQAVAEGAGVYDGTDLELLELLASHVEETLTRLRAERERLSERDRLRALFENVPDPAVRYEFVGGDPIVRAVNGAFCDVFGYDADEILGENVDEYIIPPGHGDEGRELNEALMAGETVQHVTQRRTNDDVRDFKINVVPLELGERGVEGFSIYTDITDQKRRERELRDQNERLDRFASVVSHDLRNPLSVASAYLEQARETGDYSLLEEVERGHERTFAIIEDVLTIAREGGDVTDPTVLDLASVATDAWANVDTNGATLDVAETRTLEADRSRLRQLLENLFRNCFEHGRPADGDVTVTVRGTTGGFVVADDGVGFSEVADLDRLFEFGYSTTTDGTGLGLSIVAEIADGHGWSVTAANGDDGGARFVFDVEADDAD
ncbi:GAF domain-containing protein [Halovivax gelatinilyticus]|uniref:GAF domain-containing protein n=1 Tax=Halovivax gelatinilyticus TaxID=2961597 RepID=UPI0020CA7726|nr:GAF domain-containing protein [Halovivax gelatinilyticus]